ncbi:L-fucose permease [Fusarium heterosporum]|uniref:L-fucose permease n=1 Tax=Fusarium heterosporum TaxID=42747 RepID=A0A8H5TK52_FUSHE|nr:L-fucose permease [Fusarium heterosporum]
MLSRQYDLWTAEFITFPAATVFLILRIISRRITKAKFWWDDFFAILSYATAVVWAIVLPIWINHGFGLHSDNVKGMTVIEANYLTKKYLFIIEHLYAFTLFFAKISILSFYWRMFRVANIQLIVSVWSVCSILWILVRTFLTTFHCYPVQAFWDPTVENATCSIKSSDFFFGTVLAHVIIDVGILILPIMQIQKLQLPLLQKAAILLMFMFGILVCVAGLVIVSVSTNFDNKSHDMTWQLAPVITWASVEVNLVTVSTCLPIIRPACLYLISCKNPMPSSIKSISNNHSRSYTRSQGKHSIRLGTIPKDKSSSTHELTRSEPNGGESFTSEFEADIESRHGNIATVTSSGSPTRSMHVPGISGIVVKSETVVDVSNVEPNR